jgi:hypothetical protein
LVKCPCCGYDTLTEKGRFEICELCSWEDEGLGRIEPPNSVIGGANGDYSLLEARENFCKYLTMYRPSETSFQKERDEPLLTLKRKIMDAFNNLETENSDEGRKQLNLELKELRERLYKLVYGNS